MRPIAIVVLGTTVPGVLQRRGDFADWFATALATDVCVVDVRAGAAWPELDELAGAVLTGSGAMVTEREPWSVRASRWLAGAVPAGLPVLGVCYGHQLLADTLHGRVDWNPRGRELGTVEVECAPGAASHELFGVLPPRFLAQASHSQSVAALPPRALVMAHNAHDPHQAAAFGPRAFGVQFHPEFDADIVRGYVDERAADLVAEGHDPAALRATTRDDAAPRALLTRFADLCGAWDRSRA